MMDVRKIMVHVKLYVIVQFLLTAAPQFRHFLLYKEMRPLAWYTGRRTEIQSVHKPAFEWQHGCPLDDMIGNRELVYYTMLGDKDFLGNIRGGTERTCCKRMEKLLKVCLKVRLESPNFMAVALLTGIAPICGLEILLRRNSLRYVSLPFHGVMAVLWRCHSVRLRLLVPAVGRTSTSTGTSCIVHLSPWGAVLPHFQDMGQTNAHVGKLEGRAIVPIGIRDTIVRIEVLKASIGSIVTIATAIRHAETRNSSHVETTTDIIMDDTLQIYTKSEYGKNVKEQIVFSFFKSP